MSEPPGYPRLLAPVRAPITLEAARNAAASLGPDAKAARSLVDAGLVPPDVLAAMSLFLLAGQPRKERRKEAKGSGSSAVAGGVWVREQYTIHQPVRVGETLEVTGSVVRAYTRSGRRYSVTVSETRGESGALAVANCTTGLVRYRPDPDLADGEEGLAAEALPVLAPGDGRRLPEASQRALAALAPGDEITAPEVAVPLAWMRARDGERSRNPIHTDPEAARAAGLDAPIVGGSHVLAFSLDAAMRAWGREVLLHGAHLDARFRSPVRADDSIRPRVVVAGLVPERVDVDLEVRCGDRTATTARLVLPRPGT